MEQERGLLWKSALFPAPFVPGHELQARPSVSLLFCKMVTTSETRKFL